MNTMDHIIGTFDIFFIGGLNIRRKIVEYRIDSGGNLLHLISDKGNIYNWTTIIMMEIVDG